MPLTKNFKTTVMMRAQKDKVFREAMLAEALTELLSGDLEVGKAILRDYINAVISFEMLSQCMGKNSKSIMHMLSPRGNPTSKSLLAIVHAIQQLKKVHFKIVVY